MTALGIYLLIGVLILGFLTNWSPQGGVVACVVHVLTVLLWPLAVLLIAICVVGGCIMVPR